jgi:hypothetical protein
VSPKEAPFFFAHSKPQPKGQPHVMHPVLKNAIENPRFARPYGSDRGDLEIDASAQISVDRYIRQHLVPHYHAANDNVSVQHSN